MPRFKNSHIAGITGLLLLFALSLHLLGLSQLKGSVLVVSSLFAGYFIAVKAFKALRMRRLSM